MNAHSRLPGERPLPTALDVLKATKRAAWRQLQANWAHRHGEGVRRLLVLRAVARLSALAMTPDELRAAIDAETADTVRLPALVYVLALKERAAAERSG